MSGATLDLGHLLNRAQRGDGAAVIGEIGDLLADRRRPDDERIRLLLVLCVAHIARGDFRAAIDGADRCLHLASSIGAMSRQANALALRGSAHRRLGESNQALDDVIEAEVWLSRTALDAAATSAHVGIGHVYADLRLFELAEPHWILVAQSDALDGLAPDAGTASRRGRVVDHLNLAGLHLTWDDELARLPAADFATARADHQVQCRRWLDQVDGSAEGDGRWWSSAVISARLDVASRIHPVDALPALEAHCRVVLSRREAGGIGVGTSPAEPVALLSALSAAHRALGRSRPALDAARAAVALLTTPGVDPAVTKNAHYQLHRAQLADGMPGSVSMDGFVRACDRELWAQRMDAVEGVRARRDFAILDRQQELTSRLMLEDPLTRALNRRALSEWLVAHPDGPMTLVMVDLDHFKSVNDRFGHAAGDQVLVRVAETLRMATREHDMVARFGGDEFVVAFDHDHFELGDITDRLSRAVTGIELADLAPGLRVAATAGAASAAFGESARDLLFVADRRMLEAKHASG